MASGVVPQSQTVQFDFDNDVYPFATYQSNFHLTTTPGSQISSISCFVAVGGNTSFPFSASAAAAVYSFGLLVYYTGTAPPANTAIQIVPPLTYNSANLTMGVDPNASFQGLDLVSTTVGGLPGAAAYSHTVWQVRDGTGATDCSTGGGATQVQCYSNGSSWTALSGGGVRSGIQCYYLRNEYHCSHGWRLRWVTGPTGTGTIQATSIASTISAGTNMTITAGRWLLPTF